VCDFFSTGLVKILKKYNKRTGAGLLLPGIATLQEKALLQDGDGVADGAWVRGHAGGGDTRRDAGGGAPGPRGARPRRA
jgi:hypothetical protein